MRFARRLTAGTAAAIGMLLLGWLAAAARPRPYRSIEGAAGLPPPLPQGRTVDVPGRGEMFVREVPADDPSAPTVVLLHGWMYPADLHWYRIYAELGGRVRIIAPDHRGHGRGSRPSQPFRLGDVADDVAALLAVMDARPAVAVGYSMGGQIAQLLWRRHPDAVAGLVLCATSDSYDKTLAYRMIWRAMSLVQLALRLVPRSWTERLLAAQADGRLPVRITRMISSETPEDLTTRLGWVVGEFDRGSAEDLAEAGRELSRFDSRPWIGGTDVPTAVIVTCQDRLVPPAWQAELARRIPGSHVIELPLDHDGIVSHPELFIPALEKALAWVQSRR